MRDQGRRVSGKGWEREVRKEKEKGREGGRESVMQQS
jgi:hypothetical protein